MGPTGGGAHPDPKHGGGGPRKNGWAWHEAMSRSEKAMDARDIVAVVDTFLVSASLFYTTGQSDESVCSAKRRRVRERVISGQAEHALTHVVQDVLSRASLIFWI